MRGDGHETPIKLCTEAEVNARETDRAGQGDGEQLACGRGPEGVWKERLIGAKVGRRRNGLEDGQGGRRTALRRGKTKS